MQAFFGNEKLLKWKFSTVNWTHRASQNHVGPELWRQHRGLHASLGRAGLQCIVIHSTVTIITSNKQNYSHSLYPENLASNVIQVLFGYTHTHPHAYTYTHARTQLVSALCAPCWLLVHLNKCGVEAQHWQILTVLHLISGCSIQMKEQGDGLEHNGCMSAPHSMLSSGCEPTKHWLCIYLYLAICSLCVQLNGMLLRKRQGE